MSKDQGQEDRELAFMNAMSSADRDAALEDEMVKEVVRRMLLVGGEAPDQQDVIRWLYGERSPSNPQSEAAVRSVSGGWRCWDLPFIHETTKEVLVSIFDLLGEVKVVTEDGSGTKADVLRRRGRREPGYGYRLKDEKVEPHPDEQQVVTLVWYLRKMGASINKVSHVLYKVMKVKNRRGEPFWPEQVVALTMLLPAEELRKLN